MGPGPVDYGAYCGENGRWDFRVRRDPPGLEHGAGRETWPDIRFESHYLIELDRERSGDDLPD